MLPDIPEASPDELEAQAQRSLGQRFRLLFSLATLKTWWQYTRVGTIWLWAVASGGAVISGQEPLFQLGSGLVASVINWVLSLLIAGVVCLMVAAIGMLPLIVHAALDRRRGHIGFGFLLGLVLGCTLLVTGFWALFQLRDLIMR
ncbi:MAG: hypothetical protein AB7E72_21970 [Lysobacterales bacterium]